MTLVEMLLVLSLSLVVITLVVTAYMLGARVLQEKMVYQETSLEASRGMEWLTADVQKSRRILSAEAQSFSLWLADTNSDQIIDPDELITYALVGNQLVRYSPAETRILTDQVAGLTFSYAPAVDPTLLSVNLKIASDYETSTWETRARLRNYP